MYKRFNLILIILVLSFSIYPIKNVFSGFRLNNSGPSTDTSNIEDNIPLIAFFDLRNRESFVQVTNVDGENQNLHIQIFNVADNCNENNFFDLYTGNDTHIYNMRNILTNDGNPSGVA